MMQPLTEDDVHVWYVRPEHTTAPELIRRYEALLSRDERERYRRFVFAADRHRHLIARALVRTTLSRYADVDASAWVFKTTQFGRPEIAGSTNVPPLRFSLSHTRGLVALAVALRFDIGIDVEHATDRTGGLDIAREFFASSEADDLDALPHGRQPRAFLEYWTLKEAYVKATGLGLSIPLQSFAFQLATPPVIRFDSPRSGDPSAWYFSQLELSADHVAALATRRVRRPSIVVRQTVPLGNCDADPASS